MWRCPHRATAPTLGCAIGQVGNKLFIVLSDCWHGGPGPPIWVCVCVRDSGCLMPGALPPYSCWIRVPEFGLCGLLSQTIFYRTVWSSGEGCRALPCPSCPPHSWVSAEVVLDSRTGSRGSAPGPSRTARVFFVLFLFLFVLFLLGYFFRLQFLVSGAPFWPLSSGV